MPVITKPNQHFDATLYTGNGGTQSITNAGSMQPDFVWIKSRSTIKSHCITDVVRGTNLQLASNSTGADQSTTDGITAFNSNGFSLGAGVQQYSSNDNGTTYVAWQWKAGGTAVTNTSGSISSQVSVNTTAGFSIVTFTAPSGSTAYTVGHGLGTTPAMIIVKERGAAGNDWYVWHQSYSNTAQGNQRLNTTAAVGNSSQIWNNTAPTSTVFSSIAGTAVASSTTAVAYCWAEVAGYSAFGSYTGNGSSNGPFVYTGFRPKYILTKKTNASGTQWNIWDSVRNTYNVAGSNLWADSSEVEATSDSSYGVDILSNGFKLRNSSSGRNASGDTYIYAAFAEAPFKYANAR